MIIIHKNKTADTRTCDYSKVTKKQLIQSSQQHILDVGKGIVFLSNLLLEVGINHDKDKILEIGHFYSDFITGFKETGWWDNHRKNNRHHLLREDGIPEDVNLIDVLEMIIDCVMAGMGRTGSVYPIDINPDLLMNAFQNTVRLLKDQVIIEG